MICTGCQTENDGAADTCFHCGKTFGSLTKGSVIAQRYEILQLLGRGGMGMIFKAKDRVLDETVALKTLRPQISGDADMVRRFRAEIKMARKIRHKNVCAIHDYGEEGALLYISMEYIDGIDLKQVVREEGGFTADEGYNVAIQVAKGLEAIHEAGVIHRDLKAHNIMRDTKGVCKLLDFGIAKQEDAEGGMTGTGQIVGTPEYMSPEQVRGAKVDPRSDIYALGIVFYEVFTGSVPFRGDTPVITIFKHLQEEPVFTGPQAAGIPEAMIPVLRAMLAKNPVDRLQTAGDVIEALRQARGATIPEFTPTPLLARPATPGQGGTTPVPGTGPLPPFTPVPAPVPPMTPRPLTPAPQPAPEPDVVEAEEMDLSQTISEQPVPPSLAPPPPAPAPPPTRSPTLVGRDLARTVAGESAVAAPAPAPPPAAPTIRPAAVAPAPAVPSPTGRMRAPTRSPAAAPRVEEDTRAPARGYDEAPSARQRPAPARAGGGSRAWLFAIPVVAILGGGVVAVLLLRDGVGKETAPTPAPDQPAAVTSGTPPTVTTPREVPIVEEVTIVDGATPTPAIGGTPPLVGGQVTPAPPGPTIAAVPTQPPFIPLRPEPTPPPPSTVPAAARVAEQVGGLLGRADSSLAAGQYEGALAQYEEALRLDPQNARASGGKASVEKALALYRRAFVAGSTARASGKAAKGGGPAGFDVGEASVQRAPDFEGRIDFDVSPKNVKPGDTFTVKVYVTNEGKKPAKLQTVTLTTTVNGSRSPGSVPPPAKELAVRERILLNEVSGTWKEGTTSWSMNVLAASNKNDTAQNTLTWK